MIRALILQLASKHNTCAGITNLRYVFCYVAQDNIHKYGMWYVVDPGPELGEGGGGGGGGDGVLCINLYNSVSSSYL